MDDTEDDARYPPNPHRPPFRSSNPSARFLAPIIPNYVDDDDDNDPDDISTPSDDSDDVDRRPDARDGDDSSSESRGKRRRLDKLALGFEFAPRVAPKPPAARSPADWSEGSTFALLDAWGGPFVQNGRKSLRSDEWSEVARQVSRASKIPRSDAQCRNRVDTLKKKYKKEKARIAGSVKSTSDWVYFDQMDALMSSPTPPAEQLQPRRLPGGVDAGEYLFASSKAYVDRSNGQDEMRDSLGYSGPEDGNEEEEGNDSEGLPPVKERPSSFSLLADSIRRLGEVYEKMESNKRLQMAELERMRKEFQKDLEVQKKQILERAQAEIAKIRQEDGEEEDDEEDEEEEEDSDDNGDDDEEEDGM